YDTAGTRLLYTTNGSTSTTYTHDANGAVENFGSTSISWTSFGKARTISQAGTTRQMSYDADGARVIRETSNRGGFTVTPHPLYERRYDSEGVLEEARIRATNAAGAVVGEFRFDYQGANAWKRGDTRYVHDDHLGSAGLVTNADGAEVDRVAYDVWGRARDATDWSAYVADSATDDIPVGFTGHQAELDGGLINMRGRMYDPRLGRFMSVDPVVAGATDAAAWNSYAYVKNRPLSLVDPTGLAPEGEGDPNSGWAEGREWSEEHGTWCDYISDDNACGRIVRVPRQASEVSLGTSGGPVGAAYWGAGDGSGVGMRNSNELAALGDPKFMTKQQLREEVAYVEALGGRCSASGNVTTCRMPNEAKSVQKAMSGAFALVKALDVGSEAALDVGVLLGNPYAVGASIALYAADEAAGLHDEQNAEWADLVKRAGQGDDEAFEELVWKIGSSRLPGGAKGPKGVKETGSYTKPSLSAHKEALKKVHKEVGGPLPPGKAGKFGSPQRGTPKKGYRLDPGHPGRPKGDPEAGPHINWWDYTGGKRGSGGRSGAIPIE
ncbi:MAG: hypothetical protein NXI35_38400, partial [bacterium]|nr:hypothetical protein [bacterium]